MSGAEYNDERRRSDNLVIELMQAIKEKVESIDSRLTRHIAEETQKFHEMMNNAFPNGDAHGHRVAHEAFLREMEDRHELRKALIEKLVTGGVWTAIGVIVSISWYWLKGHL